MLGEAKTTQRRDFFYIELNTHITKGDYTMLELLSLMGAPLIIVAAADVCDRMDW